MAPKTSKTTASADATSGTTLTPKETQILLAVVSLMPEVPDVNFEDVAKLLKIKYSKNARAATKVLFAKLKAQAPTSADVDDGNEADDDAAGEGDEEEEAAEQATSGRATRAKAKVVSAKKVTAKKGVGKSAAPKKATATKKTAKAVPAEPVEEEEENVEEEGDAQVEEDGKSTFSVSVVQISTPAITFTRPSIEPESLRQSELESPTQAKNEKALPLPFVESLTEPDSESGMDIDQEQDGATERELEQKRLLDTLSPQQKQIAYKSLYSRITNLLKETSPAVHEPVLPYYYPATPMPTLSMKIKGLDFQFTQEDINRAEFYELSLYDYLAWKLVNLQYFNE